MRPMGIGKKPPVYTDPCMSWLMRLSKAALADCVVDLLRGQAADGCDEEITEQAAIERLSAVIVLRKGGAP